MLFRIEYYSVIAGDIVRHVSYERAESKAAALSQWQAIHRRSHDRVVIVRGR